MKFEIHEVKKLPYTPEPHELPPCDCRLAVRARKELKDAPKALKENIGDK